VQPYSGATTKIMDLGGHTVLPGLQIAFAAMTGLVFASALMTPGKPRSRMPTGGDSELTRCREDHNAKFDAEVIGFLRATGLKAKRTGVLPPWQNGTAERWVGSCRREILD
jgi:hypothetical protein